MKTEEAATRFLSNLPTLRRHRRVPARWSRLQSPARSALNGGLSHGSVEKINYPGISNYTQFTFDSLGRNTKTVETSSGSVTSTKQNLWSTNLRQEERDGSGSLTRQYFTSGRASISSGSSTNYFYTADHLGSVRELLDSSGGPQAQYAYSPFGGKTNMLDEAASADFQFTGFYLHERSNLSLTKFRAFHSQLGRWLSRDPMGQNTENNQFAYCLNDPVQNIDPSGLWLTPAQVEAKAGEIMKMLEAGDNKSRYLSNNFVLCQIYNESTFDPESESGAGAKGMMGVTRIGALQVGSKMSEMGIPNKNIRAGTRIDDYFIDQNKGDIQRGIIQYSGGHGKPYYDHIKACECCLNKRDKDKAKGKNTASLYECLEKA